MFNINKTFFKLFENHLRFIKRLFHQVWRPNFGPLLIILDGPWRIMWDGTNCPGSQKNRPEFLES